MTSLKGDLRSIMGTPFGGVGHAVLIFSRVTRAAFNSDSVVLQLHDRIEMPEEADGKFRVDGLDPGPIRIELEGGTVHNHGWNIDLPDEGVWSLTDLVDAQVDWSPAVIGRAEAAAREARDHADRAEAGADRVGTAEQVGVWASEASSSASAAASARSAAQTARNASQSARDAAEGHASRAATSESNAKTSETNAKQSETNAGDYAAVATTAATEAVDAMELATGIAIGEIATRSYVDSAISDSSLLKGGLGSTDLNTLFTPGFHAQGTGSLATAERNYPVPITGVALVVQVGSGQFLQLYLTYQYSFTRRYVGGAWGSWRSIGLDRDSVLGILGEAGVRETFKGDPGQDGATGPEGPQGAPGPEGPQGIPGADAVPTAQAVADYAEADGSPLNTALAAMFEPKAHERGITRRIYVRATGRDEDGDGSSTAPFREISTAVNTLASDGPVIRGSVIIDVGPGTYAGGIRMPVTRGSVQDDFVKIVGTVDTSGVPTSIVQADSGTGILAQDGTALWVENIKIQGSFSVGIQATQNVYFWAANVHVDGMNAGVRGFSISSHSRYYVRGGLIENCTYAGIDEYFNVVRSYATVSKSADQMLIRNCGIGIRMKEGCVGHLDYLRVEGCATGIELLQHCVSNLKGVELRRNGVGLAIINSSSHNEGGIVWGTGQDANTREVYSVGSSAELRAMMWSGEDMAQTANRGHRPLMQIAGDYENRTISGDGSDAPIANFSSVLARPFFRTEGKRFEVRLLAAITGATPESPIRIRFRIGNVLLGYADVFSSGSASITSSAVCVKEGEAAEHFISTSAEGVDAVMNFRKAAPLGGVASGVASVSISAQASAGQSVEVHAVEMYG